MIRLPEGLRIEPSNTVFWCAKCGQMKGAGTICLRVPRGIKPDDSDALITERCRITAFSEPWAKWCQPCGQGFLRREEAEPTSVNLSQLSKEQLDRLEQLGQEKPASWIKRSRRWLGRVIAGEE